MPIRRIYLDNAATTPVDPDVVAAMLPYFLENFGNASSIHSFGQTARAAVDNARRQIAELIGARHTEIIFTSGGTEANNLAIRGLVESNSKHGRHIVISAIEHPAVQMVCEDLEKRGYSLTKLPVYTNGIIRVEDVREAIRDETVLVSVMTANNEIGTIQPIVEIGRIVKEIRDGGKKIWFHTDAVQALGKIPIDVEEIGCDLLSMSAHKIYAPKGAGALFVRRGVRLHSQNIGGRQERQIRGGTEAVPLLVGFGEACAKAGTRLNNNETLADLRDRLENGIIETIPDCHVNGDRTSRLPNISNLSFRGTDGEAILINLDMHGIAVSTGSACSSGSIEPSPIIASLGNGDEIARSSVRFSLGISTTEDDVLKVVEILPETVSRLRQLAPR